MTMGSSNPAGTLPPFDGRNRDAQQDDSKRAWIIALVIALAVHLAGSLTLPRALRHARPVSISLQPVSQGEIDRLKDQWKQIQSREREQQILLDHSKATEKDKETPPPEDSKFIADKNIRVDRQTRAKDASVLPHPGAPGAPGAEAVPAPSRAANPMKHVDLAKLGVPLGMNDKAQARAKKRQDASPQGQAGASQAILDDDIPAGGQNLLNARESVYYSFYSRIYESIAPIWESRAREVPRQRRLAPGDYLTIVEIEIDAPGSLVGVRVIRSSGVAAFDQAVIDSWRKLARFPNPPRGLLDGRGHVAMKWSFQFRLTPGAALQAGNPRREF